MFLGLTKKLSGLRSPPPSMHPDVETVGYLDHASRPHLDHVDVRGKLRTTASSTRSSAVKQDGHQWPFVEKWELD